MAAAAAGDGNVRAVVLHIVQHFANRHTTGPDLAEPGTR